MDFGAFLEPFADGNYPAFTSDPSFERLLTLHDGQGVPENWWSPTRRVFFSSYFLKE